MGAPIEFDNYMRRALKTLHQVYFFRTNVRPRLAVGVSGLLN